MKQLITSTILATLLTSCATVMLDTANKLEKGMSKQQVTEIMGEPLIKNFSEDKTIYEYKVLRPFHGPMIIRVVMDANDKLISKETMVYRTN